MKKILVFNFWIIPYFILSQVTFIADAIPDYTPPDDTLYIAGNFNGWDPGNSNFMLSKNAGQKWQITLPAVTEGTQIQFKFTLGSWERVEKGPNGEEIGNRFFTFGNGDTIHVVIANWANGGGGGSTAADNVQVMDDDFEMPQLGRTRRIWLYLPPDYGTSGVNYPVLYMHDGQNLFDDETSYAGEWRVDETLNSLYDDGYKVPIVVGIDNGGGERLNEYTPWQHPDYGGGDGELYMQFIVETLKPYIDQHYRTLPSRENTGIMGSSLGGLISHYGALEYQEIFSKAGIFSPSYWFSDSLWSFTREAGRQDEMRLYLMCGGAEGQNTINDIMDMQDSLLAEGFPAEEMSISIIPGGQHNEILWSSDFGDAYKWLFTIYANEIQEPSGKKIIQFYPNPAKSIVTLPPGFPEKCDSLEVVNMEGKTVMKSASFSGNSIDISGLAPGIYLVLLITDSGCYQGKVVKE